MKSGYEKNNIVILAVFALLPFLLLPLFYWFIDTAAEIVYSSISLTQFIEQWRVSTTILEVIFLSIPPVMWLVAVVYGIKLLSR